MIASPFLPPSQSTPGLAIDGLRELVVGADHGGFLLKTALIDLVEQWSQLQQVKVWNLVDGGADHLDPDDDYPEIALAVAIRVAQTQNSRGVLLCRSSAGVCITANKVRGIRAVSASSVAMVEHARAHNDANMLCLAADQLTAAQALELVVAFLETAASQESRHVRRRAAIADYEETVCKSIQQS